TFDWPTFDWPTFDWPSFDWQLATQTRPSALCYNVPMRNIISSIPAAFLLLALLATRLAAFEYTSDDFAKVQQNLAEKKAVLIDVREVGEWKQSHLKQATLV